MLKALLTGIISLYFSVIGVFSPVENTLAHNVSPLPVFSTTSVAVPPQIVTTTTASSEAEKTVVLVPSEKTLSTSPAPLTSSSVNPTPDASLSSIRKKISAICSASPKSDTSRYAPGEIILSFNKTFSAGDIKSFLQKNGLELKASYFLDQPTEVLIKWNSEFEKTHTITLDEINNFAASTRNNPLVKSFEISTFWHTWPLTQEGVPFVQTIDRWGYFTLTFPDAAAQDAFFKSNPDATFFAAGVPGGIYFNDAETGKVTVLFKADDALRTLHALREKIGSGKKSLNVTDLYEGSKEVPILFIDETQWDAADTTYVISFGVQFPSDYSNDAIRTVLARYPSIDAKQSIIKDRLDMATITVPHGEEECWSNELNKIKLPQIDSAVPNMYMSLN